MIPVGWRALAIGAMAGFLSGGPVAAAQSQSLTQCLIPQAPGAGERGPVCMNSFYDVLSDYGTWLDTDRLGTVFCPSPEIFGPDFKPYARGHWVMSEAGWTFVGPHSTSWVTDHYGRWVQTRLRGCQWAWVPGEAWSPAWVDFRVGERVVAWRPAPFDGVAVRLQIPPGVTLPRVHLGPPPPPTSEGMVAVVDTDFGANQIGEVALTGPDLYAALRDTTPLPDLRAGLHSRSRYAVVAAMLESKGIVRPGPGEDEDGAPAPPEPARRVARGKPGVAGTVSASSHGVKNGEGPVKSPPGTVAPGAGKVYQGGNHGTGGFNQDGASGGVKVLEWGKPKPPPPKPE